MKKDIIYISIISLFCSVQAYPQQVMDRQINVSNVEIRQNGDSVSVRMDMDISVLKIPANRSVILTPSLQTDEKTQTLPPIEIMGRKRYIYYIRNKNIVSPGETYRIVERKNKTRQQIHYHISFTYEKPLNSARLILNNDECGCCNIILDTQEQMLTDTTFLPAAPDTFIPRFAYIKPEVETIKERSEKGSAYIDFAVGRSDIRPGYRNNPDELAKIKNTIELIKNDPDTKITHITIKGFASPDGKYETNRNLAKARTDALSQYIEQQYGFTSGLFILAYEAEDWDGLRKFVENSDLAEKNTLLDLIDGTLAPDAKEKKLKSAHPETYRYLQNACFPALRHSDYEVEYTVRGFNVEEARQIIKERPQKLSLQEIYLVAQTYETGSEESNEVFETAARLFPEAPTANLNAANAALQRNELKRAARYLEKAGDSPQAINARAIFALLQEDSARAKELFKQAASMGLPEAKDNLDKFK